MISVPPYVVLRKLPSNFLESVFDPLVLCEFGFYFSDHHAYIGSLCAHWILVSYPSGK